MKNTSTIPQPRLFIKHKLVCALLALAATLTVTAQPTQMQETVFNDTFGSSTLNQTNAFPTGTPTASSTSYTLGSSKSAGGSTISLGHLNIFCPATSSGNSEAQALFTTYPVTLQSTNDYIELDYTWTDCTNEYNGLANDNGSGFFMGLYNAGQVPPLGGNILTNSGFSSAQTAYLGGTRAWVGYPAQMLYSENASSPWNLRTRPSEIAVAANTDQLLTYNYAGGTAVNGPAIAGPFPFPDLTVGAQYTSQLRITLSAAGTLTLSNAMYAGIGTGGTIIYSNVTTFSGANLLATNFDGLGLGMRAEGGTSLPAWTNQINSITVVAGLLANAGPYFTATNQLGGNGCGSADVSLNGSVTTNTYYLYDNGINTGVSMPGTGSLIDFGTETVAGIYTIVASNPATGNVGPMYGNVTISVSAPVINTGPANASCVTNAPASFTVAATGVALTYQWYKNGVALTNGGDYSGVTTTNLLVSPAQLADAATTANGYYVVVQNPCGDSVTSSPNASLTLEAPHNLVWQGNNSINWDSTTLNFTNPAGTSVAFTYGDNATFNDTSPNTGVILSTNLTPSLVEVNGTEAYYFFGPGKITGFGEFIDNDTNVVTIISTNTYTGGTVISSNAILSLGNGNSGNDGFVSGVVNVNTNGTLDYNYYSDQNIANALAGSGTVNYNSENGGTFTLGLSTVNSNFTGVANLVEGVRVHAQTGSVYPFGNLSTVNVQPYSQAWCDGATYNNTFNIAGTGWSGTTPTTGAISVYQATFIGPINLTADARISGTIVGGTILSTISGPYTLEIYGTLGSYVLSMGPTNNGIDSYSATLITSGSVRALNTNALSTGPLTMDLAADLRLNSYNLMVTNLASTNQGIFSGPGATIQNTGATNAIFTFGADNSSKEFDGTFTNGGTGTLGVNKIGAGVETLTAVNYNTGPVTVSAGTLAFSGSGSFNNAAVIAVRSGAVYDVTGVGSLTLNSGQTLTGSGRINGSVNASAGSTINPGDTIGALTVSGNLTLAGTVQMELNRANAPATNDSITASGTITGGGTLNVTNLGPVLHVGDSFKLFSSSVSGFTAVNLETNDTLNNAIYTWNNTISSDGKITVATVVNSVTPFTVPPHITSFSLSGGNVVMSGTNAQAGDTYYLLSSTNAALPLSQWTVIATNVAAGANNFTFTGTNGVSLPDTQQYYILSNTNN